MASSIEVSGLTKRYGAVAAVDDVSFSVDPGEVFVLVGPNGAGKTTTVEIIEGLRGADSGTARVLGLTPGSRALRARVGVMPQEGDLYSGIRTHEAVRLFASFYDEPLDPSALIEQLGLGEVRRTQYRRLSGGEKRRLSLALALIGRPEVAFLDEPTAGMDLEGRATTWAVIGELRARGTSVVLTTHLLDEAERVADRVAILHHGRLAAIGPLAELTAGRIREVEFTVASPIDEQELRETLGVDVQATRRDAYRIPGREPTPELIAAISTWLSARGVLLRRLEVGPRSLEDLYMEITQ
ncbi:MAG TPA: ABC transporter ATP-binding protein [Actinomycetota bacterium]|jgi:ABC-2 type transport system ATP-binding protein|nr:ABC transporter ATP-binding protein [Actinomycetota bacterium]